MGGGAVPLTANPLLDAAKEYLAAGFSPFPVEPNGKRPLVQWRQFADTLPTAADLERWWAETPSANVGLALRRGQWVLDVDGETGRQALIAAGLDTDDLGFNGVVKTGKGWHHYYSGDVPNAVGVLPNVDVRGYGGYTVAPPSVHAKGTKYTWALPLPAAGPAKASPALLAVLARPAAKPTAGPTDDPIVAWANGVSEGGRDVACTRAAGKLIGLGLSPDAVEALLLPGADRCNPPFPAADVAKCVESIARKHGPVGFDQPTGKVAVSDFIDAVLSTTRPSAVLPTGIPRLDFAINGGLYPGQVLYCAGMGGVGKSIWAESFALDTADADNPVLYVPLEMSVAEMSARLLSRYTKINSRRLLKLFYGGAQPEEQEVRVLRGTAKLVATTPIEFHPGLLTLEALDYYLLERGTTKLVVLDQLHHMDGSQETPGLEANSRGLVRLAKKHDVAVVALCMVNRPDSANRNTDWRPTRWSLRGSERLYHDCDTLLLLHRQPSADRLEIQVAKGRFGGASEEWFSVPYAAEFCKVG